MYFMEGNHHISKSMADKAKQVGLETASFVYLLSTKKMASMMN